MKEKIKCSVIILTFNEQINIDACLASLSRFDDVHVVDSGSSDATLHIARQRGATIHINPFSSFAQQRNWAHQAISPKYRWALHLDADERMTDALADEIAERIEADHGTLAGFYLAEMTIFMGKWLRYAGQYPRYQARLVHIDRMTFIDHGHGQREKSDLPFGTLQSPYRHFAFSAGLDKWLKKHAGYAVEEARMIRAEQQKGDFRYGDLMSRDRNLRRRALKAVGMNAPFRPFLRWLYIIVIRQGFRDGYAGFVYAHMMWLFQHMIDFCLKAERYDQRKLSGDQA